jgi:hypothetical protein
MIIYSKNWTMYLILQFRTILGGLLALYCFHVMVLMIIKNFISILYFALYQCMRNVWAYRSEISNKQNTRKSRTDLSVTFIEFNSYLWLFIRGCKRRYYDFWRVQYVYITPEEVGQQAAKHHGHWAPNSTRGFIDCWL